MLQGSAPERDSALETVRKARRIRRLTASARPPMAGGESSNESTCGYGTDQAKRQILGESHGVVDLFIARDAAVDLTA